MGTLFMIRHGQASFGQKNYDKLSDLGHRQSHVLGERLLNTDVRFDAVYSGTLARQIDTATIVSSVFDAHGIGLPQIQQLDAFNEYESESVLRGLIPAMIEDHTLSREDVDRIFDDQKSFQRVFETVMRRWVSGTHTLPGMIQWEEFCQTVEKGIAHIMNTGGRGSNIALFTSGGPIAAAVRRALQLSDPVTIQVSWQVVNTSVSCFKFTQNRFMLSTFNEHSHLEKTSITYR